MATPTPNRRLRGLAGRVRRLGLRARISIAFAAATLLLTGTLSVLTLGVTREVLLTNREDGAFQFALRNAEAVRNNLPSQVNDVVSALNTSYGSQPVIRVGTEWYSQNPVELGRADLPQGLRAIVDQQDTAARQRAEIRGHPMLVVGIPIPGDVDASYYEAIDLADTDDTLQVLSTILIGTTAVATVVSAVLGYWVSRRTLLPLTEVSQASRLIADGRLDTRIEPPADRDLARLVEGFNDMAQALEARISRDGRFASEVSHELRSPLMTLTASVAVLENSKDSLPPRAVTALELLATDIERFTQLVEDLLEISRFDVGTARLERDDLLVTEFVRQVLRHESLRHVPVDVSSDVENLVIQADKRRLGRVMSNLLDNARKYAGGAVRVELDRTEDRLLIAVEDAGPGVAPDERLVIFDRFSRGSSGGRRGADTGVGLGLALVTEDVNLHGGEVWVEDRSDGEPGGRFVVGLPLPREVAE